MTIIFENPPNISTSGRGPGAPDYKSALDKKPGQWARVREYDIAQSAYTVSTQINRAVVKWAAPAGTYQSVARKLPNGKTAVYVRRVK